MNEFLIPANSKKSMLIFGVFNTSDLIMFVVGLGTTLLLMMTLSVDNLANVIIAILPLAVTGFLVMPIPNYHNTKTFLTSMIQFYTNRQTFIWKGWCFLDDKDSKK